MNASRVDEFQQRCRHLQTPVPEILTGERGLCQIASGRRRRTLSFLLPSELPGFRQHTALWPAGKNVALANKEAMVLAGELLRATASKTGAQLIPIDSEHSALDQCLRSGHRKEVRRLILTASGGPLPQHAD
jgi:1-deoxy-D-xylulose-5-phosphate reductoisomerase